MTIPICVAAAVSEMVGVDRLAQALRPRNLHTRRLGRDLLILAEW